MRLQLGPLRRLREHTLLVKLKFKNPSKAHARIARVAAGGGNLHPQCETCGSSFFKEKG